MLLLTPQKNNRAKLAFKTGQRKTEVLFALTEERCIDQVRDAVGQLILRTVEKYIHHRRKILTEKTRRLQPHKIDKLLHAETKLAEIRHSRTRGIASGVLQVFDKLQGIAPGIHSRYYPQDMILLQELKRLCQSVVRDEQFTIQNSELKISNNTPI